MSSDTPIRRLNRHNRSKLETAPCWDTSKQHLQERYKLKVEIGDGDYSNLSAF